MMESFAIFPLYKITKAYQSLKRGLETTFPKERVATPTKNVDMSYSNNGTLFTHLLFGAKRFNIFQKPMLLVFFVEED